MLQWSQSSNLQVPFVLVKWISIMYKLLNLTTDLKTEDGFFYKKGIISLFFNKKGIYRLYMHYKSMQFSGDDIV